MTDVCFDDRFTDIVSYKYDESYPEILDWVDKNSKGSVDIKISEDSESKTILLGFDNMDDSLLFKIRFKI